MTRFAIVGIQMQVSATEDNVDTMRRPHSWPSTPGCGWSSCSELAVTNQCFVFDINGVGDGGNGHSIICGPEGAVLYEAGSGEEVIPIEINLEDVRRNREHGVLRLGQPLKSFRDRSKPLHASFKTRTVS